MSGQMYVTELEIKSACTGPGYNKVKEVKCEFDDGSSQMVLITQLIWEGSLLYPVLMTDMGGVVIISGTHD